MNNINLYRNTVMELETKSRTDNGKTSQSQSILTIMKDFMDSVNEMDETVLIPSRLMDIKMDNCDAVMNGNPLIGLDSDSTTSSSASLSSMSSSTSSSMSMMPSPMATAMSEHSGQVSLHTYYSMLKAVKLELARGPQSPRCQMEDDDDDIADDDDVEGVNAESRLQAATARAFREHLRGLFKILTHLTTVSKQLTDIYQQETGDKQSSLKPKSSFIV